MSRHLHNTLSALVASGSLLVIGLIAAAPLMPRDVVGAPSQLVGTPFATDRLETVVGVAAFTAEVSAAQVLATAFEQAASQTTDTESQRKTRTSPRDRRQTLVMPYLSFVPRG